MAKHTTKVRASQPRIVAAVGTAAGTSLRGPLYEKAMSDAIMKAMADGVTDPAEQRRLMHEARERVKRELDEAEARALQKYAAAAKG